MIPCSAVRRLYKFCLSLLRLANRHDRGGANQDQRWFRAPIAVTRNNVRTRLNNVAVLTHAYQVRRPIVISPATDTWSRKSRGVTNVHESGLAYVTDDKTEHLPTWLPLVERQPVIVTANIATELGLVNGAMAHIVAIIQHRRYRRHSVDKPVK